jgi:hypothetical protein
LRGEDDKMRVNEEIPGQMSARELRAIALVARLVPRSGKVVEIGSLFGRSSWTWAKNVDPTVTVYCIDPWEKNAGVRPIEEAYNIRYGLECFKHYTSDCPNIVPRRGYSPRDFQNWSERIDLFFDDAVHQDPIFSANLAFWGKFLKPSGIACGHDYRSKFPDIIKGVHRLAESMGRKPIVVENFWCLLPNEHARPGSEVQSGLTELAAGWAKLACLSQQRITLDEVRLPSRDSRAIEVFGTLQNSSGETIEICNDSPEPVRVGIRFYRAGVTAPPAMEGRAEIAVERMEPAQSVRFHLRADLASLAPGRYEAVVDIVKERCFWALDLGSEVKRVGFDLPEGASA